MEIRVDRLRDQPLAIDLDEPAATFPVLAELAGKGLVSFPGRITARLQAQMAGVLIEIEGDLSFDIVQHCSRCLQSVTQQVSVPVTLAFSHAATGDGASDLPAERELHEGDCGLLEFTGESIDLASALEQEILMAFPLRPLCRADCAGLCPVCGADRNNATCECDPPVFNSVLAGLRKLRIDKN